MIFLRSTLLLASTILLLLVFACAPGKWLQTGAVAATAVVQFDWCQKEYHGFHAVIVRSTGLDDIQF